MSAPNEVNYVCPCCGYGGLDCPAYERLNAPMLIRGLQPPYSAHFGSPSYEVCSCCGFEFGFDDEPGATLGESFEEYLARWTKNGSNWFQPASRPPQWTLESQLDGVPVIRTGFTGS